MGMERGMWLPKGGTGTGILQRERMTAGSTFWEVVSDAGLF